MFDLSGEDELITAKDRPIARIDLALLANHAGFWFQDLVPGDLSRELATQVAVQVARDLSAYLDSDPISQAEP
jgi:hypothetical protein